MARIRTLKPEFFHSKKLARCTPLARLLFAALMQLADREGRLRWIPMQVHAHAFPYEQVDISALVAELESAGSVLKYEVGDDEYLWLPSFTIHQRVKNNEAESRLPSYENRDTSSDGAQCAPPWPTPSAPVAQVGGVGKGTGNREQGTGNGRQADRADSQPFLLNPQAPARTPAEVAGDHYRERRGQTTALAVVAKEKIQTLITKGYTVEQICLVVDWSHDAPTAAHLKDNDRGKDYTRWTTVFGPEKFAGYIEEAEEWRDGGKSSSTPTQAASHDDWWHASAGMWLRRAREYSDVWNRTGGEFGVQLQTVADVVAFVHDGASKQAAREPDVALPPPPVAWLTPKVTPLALEIPWVKA